jgi:hypothetical protein
MLKSKYVALAGAAVLLSGVGAVVASGPANAASPSCGSSCIDVFSHQFGTFADPQFVMDSYKQGSSAGTAVILFRTSNSDPAEDFTVDDEGLTSEFYALGLVSPDVALAYGCVPSVETACDGSGQGDYWAYEFMYSPYGVQTGLCTGVAATAVAGEHVTLQPCGVSSKTLWIAANPVDEPLTVSCDPSTAGSACTADPCKTGTKDCAALPCNSAGTTPGCGGKTTGTSSTAGTSTVDGTEPGPFAGDHDPLASFAEPLVNGSDTDFSSPFGLTYGASSYPTDTPRPPLYVTYVLGFSSGAIGTNQLWSNVSGVLP